MLQSSHRSTAKSSAGGDSKPDAAGGNGSGRAAELDRDEDYWLRLWAFGTSPYGLALSTERFWSLSTREHSALMEVWQHSRDLPLQLHAAIQATLHNSAGKTYKDHFTADMFMPGYMKQPQGLNEKMAIAAALFTRQVKCPDCGEFVKAKEVHNCHG